MIDFAQLAEQLAAAASRVRENLARDLAEIGEAQKKLATEMIGTEAPGWAPLAASTIADKARKGYPVPAPLLRDGTMRDSLSFEVEPTPLGASMTLGSDDPVALYQECGTATIPPRPFLSTSAVAVMPVAEKLLGETAVALLTPGRLKR
jgi:hypothetical protein